MSEERAYGHAKWTLDEIECSESKFEHDLVDHIRELLVENTILQDELVSALAALKDKREFGIKVAEEIASMPRGKTFVIEDVVDRIIADQYDS